MLKYIFSSLRNAIRSLICHKEVDGGLSDFQRNKKSEYMFTVFVLIQYAQRSWDSAVGPGHTAQ